MKEKILQITSGRGPIECCWVVAQVQKKLLIEAEERGLKHTIMHREPGDINGTLKTACIKLSGHDLDTFLERWVGTAQWIGQSKFRKFHKRKNWFVGINVLTDEVGHTEVLDADIRYEFTRSGGPGGQHVNKVSTAVRAIHVPSGVAVFVSQGRSQHQNKTEARHRLLKKLEGQQFQETKERIKEGWANHNQLERGNPVRVFKGSDFKAEHRSEKYKSKRKRLKQDWMQRFDE